MALITCPECGREISDKASACPNCGCPVNKMNIAECTKSNEAKPKNELSTVRLAAGILMLILSAFILFQSCAAGVANIVGNSSSSDGSLGVLFDFAMITFGVIGIVTRKTKSFKTMFVIGALMEFIGLSVTLSYTGIYKDLNYWGFLMALIGIIFTVSGFLMRSNQKNVDNVINKIENKDYGSLAYQVLLYLFIVFIVTIILMIFYRININPI